VGAKLSVMLIANNKEQISMNLQLAKGADTVRRKTGHARPECVMVNVIMTEFSRHHLL
jgi:hypothetical protein